MLTEYNYARVDRQTDRTEYIISRPFM